MKSFKFQFLVFYTWLHYTSSDLKLLFCHLYAECDCFFDGTDGVEVCNATSGKCSCAVAEGVTGERCTDCAINDGYFVIENHTCNGKQSVEATGPIRDIL